MHYPSCAHPESCGKMKLGTRLQSKEDVFYQPIPSGLLLVTEVHEARFPTQRLSLVSSLRHMYWEPKDSGTSRAIEFKLYPYFHWPDVLASHVESFLLRGEHWMPQCEAYFNFLSCQCIGFEWNTESSLETLPKLTLPRWEMKGVISLSLGD